MHHGILEVCARVDEIAEKGAGGSAEFPADKFPVAIAQVPHLLSRVLRLVQLPANEVKRTLA